MRPLRYLIAIAPILIMAGCGGPKTAEVKGLIVFSDAPDTPAIELEGYTINFDSAEARTSGTGTVGPDGRFTMSTFKEGDGALRGKMKVAVTPPISLTDSSMGPSKIDKRHHAFETSGLEVDIQPGVNNVTLSVDRAPKKQ